MSTTDDLRARLAEDDGSLPERWNPDDTPGVTLVGMLLRYETIVTEFGESKVAVIEDDDDGTVWGVALFRSVLKKRFETLEPKPGDTLGIKYIGFAEPRNKDARGYHNYVMRVMRGDATSTGGTPAAEPPAAADDELPF